MPKSKKQFQTKSGTIQVELISGKEESKETESELGVRDVNLNNLIQREERPYVSRKEHDKVKMDTYCIVSGEAQEGTLQVKVVSVFDLSHLKDTPDAGAMLNEIDLWTQKMQSDIAEQMGMLAMALKSL